MTSEFISPVNTILSVFALPKVTLPVALKSVTVVTPTFTNSVSFGFVGFSSFLSFCFVFGGCAYYAFALC